MTAPRPLLHACLLDSMLLRRDKAYLSEVLECDTSLHRIRSLDEQQLMFPDLTQDTLSISSVTFT
jgi:hypothetical protein